MGKNFKIPRFISTHLVMPGLGMLGIAILSACNTPTKAVENAAVQNGAAPSAAGQGEPAMQSFAETIKRKPSGLSGKGTGIKATINGEAITNYDVSRRLAFMKLRRTPNANTQTALAELVDDRLKMQEAARLNTIVGDAQVNSAYANFAKSNKMTLKQMSIILQRTGVGSEHFKDNIRTQMSWQRAVGERYKMETRQKAQSAGPRTNRSPGTVQTTEYLLQQVIFVVPERLRKARLGHRRAEAETFRAGFTHCDNTLTQAAMQHDVAVKHLPRILEPQLPPRWAEDVKAISAGQTTPIKETEKGIEFLAVCMRRPVTDDRAALIVDQAKAFESFSERGDEIAKNYLNDLKKNAQIIYR